MRIAFIFVESNIAEVGQRDCSVLQHEQISTDLQLKGTFINLRCVELSAGLRDVNVTQFVTFHFNSQLKPP